MESFDNRFKTQVDFKWLEGYQKQEIKYKRSTTSTYLSIIDHPTFFKCACHFNYICAVTTPICICYDGNLYINTRDRNRNQINEKLNFDLIRSITI